MVNGCVVKAFFVFLCFMGMLYWRGLGVFIVSFFFVKMFNIVFLGF